MSYAREIAKHQIPMVVFKISSLNFFFFELKRIATIHAEGCCVPPPPLRLAF